MAFRGVMLYIALTICVCLWVSVWAGIALVVACPAVIFLAVQWDQPLPPE